MRQNVLIVGSGAREHALAWKIAQSPNLGNLYVAPGNAGTRKIATNIAIDPTRPSGIGALIVLAKEHAIGLTVVGPETPLAAGIVDRFRAYGLRIFGPGKDAAEIESSKAFAKNLMQSAQIRTAQFRIFSSGDEAAARRYIRERPLPLVIKASGPAAGKGVTICHTLDAAETTLQALMADKRHGEAGETLVIEDYLEGPELSVHALCDGASFTLLPFSRDYKRIGEGNTGENTGGMGAIAPVDPPLKQDVAYIRDTVVRKTLAGLAAQGRLFSGCLYPGLMLTQNGPAVLEYNARFGDPETQVYMRLLQSDLLDLCNACVDGTLARHEPVWHPGSAICGVLASAGYPHSSSPPQLITGIEEAERLDGIVVFQAGVQEQDGKLYTAGGRVLSVTAVGNNPEAARLRLFEALDRIHFHGMYYRKDIGL